MLDKVYEDLDLCIQEVMSFASEYAKDGVERGIGGPFGAAMIQKTEKGYQLLVIGRHTVFMEKDPTCHAEMNAIKKASRVLGRYLLEDCILISTSRPCPMCLAAACLAKINTIVYTLDYDYTNAHGFMDKEINHYMRGKNSIIKEIKIKNEHAKIPFERWEQKDSDNS